MSEDKEDKPKKAFVVVHTVWDDGEIDTELYQFVPNASGRGAPGKWRKKPDEFKKAIEDTIGSPKMIIEEMSENTGMSMTEIVGANVVAGILSDTDASKITIPSDEAALVDSPIVEDTGPSNTVTPPEDEPPEDMEFNGDADSDLFK